MANRILVVDDQSSVRQLLQEYLSEQGFQVYTVSNGEEALYTARRDHPDVILLDLMMPKMDGYQFLKAFRQEDQRTLVIIITAREEEADAVLGLELGADDYIVKPFRMRELVARIHSAMRRADIAISEPQALHIGDVALEESSHRVTVRGAAVTLTPIEFDMLALFMRAPGQVFTRTQLVDQLAASGFTGLESTLNVHIRNLRGKIEPNPSAPEYIETVFGVGYRFQKK